MLDIKCIFIAQMDKYNMYVLKHIPKIAPKRLAIKADLQLLTQQQTQHFTICFMSLQTSNIFIVKTFPLKREIFNHSYSIKFSRCLSINQREKPVLY